MTDAELNAIKAARDSGVATVSYMGRTVTYRSLDEMNAIIAKEESRRSGARRTFVRTKFRSDSGC